MTNPLFTPLTLPNGVTVPNRICKAAMEENMAEAGQVPGEALFNLYDRWAKGGAGMILTGNVMVDPTAMTGPGGVVLEHGTLEKDETRRAFARWSELGRQNGTKLVMQISHPGRQVYAAMGTQPVSASATKVALDGPAAKMFGPARALSEGEIRGLVRRFAETAFAAQRAGFDGVQIHSAHGYLVAQFLSPLTNLRDDKWGGPLENRARFLLEIVRAVRARVDADFIVSVKLNSADFQRGGYDIDDAKRVVDWLNAEAVDLVEISGGSYESAAMAGSSADGRVDAYKSASTIEREMYFFEFAKQISEAAKMPLMVTGGITKRETAEAAMADGSVGMVGIARAMAYNPELPNDWQAGKALDVKIGTAQWKNKALAALAGMAMTKQQLYRIGDGKAIKAKQNALLATIGQQMKTGKLTKRYKAWLEAQGLSDQA